MQNAFTIAKSSGRTQQQKQHSHQQEKQQISLVIIRIELDDLKQTRPHDDREEDEAKAFDDWRQQTFVSKQTGDAKGACFSDFDIISSTAQLTAHKLADLTFTCKFYLTD